MSSNLTSSAKYLIKSLIIQGFFLPVMFVGPLVGPLCTTLGHLHHKLSAQYMKAAPLWGGFLLPVVLLVLIQAST
ncbi:MAG: hypothetical protein GXZ05_12830 [Gammaproteobacteria bacterium]|nr:hypothetical protein [Gammaproteobacteria bacterium]